MRKLLVLLAIIPLVLSACGKGGNKEEGAATDDSSGGPLAGKSDLQKISALSEGDASQALGLGAPIGTETAGLGADLTAMGGGGAAPGAPVAPTAAPEPGFPAGGPSPDPNIDLSQLTEEQADLKAAIEAAAPYRSAKEGQFPAFDQVVDVKGGDRLELAGAGVVRLAGVQAPREGQKGINEAWMLLRDLTFKRFVWVESVEDGKAHIILVKPHALGNEPKFIDVNASMARNLAQIDKAILYYGQDAPEGGPVMVPVDSQTLDNLKEREAVIEAAFAAESEVEKQQLAARATGSVPAGGGAGAAIPIGPGAPPLGEG